MVRIKCSKCDKKCKGDVLKVGDKYYHKQCFTCDACNSSLEHSKFYILKDKIFCQEDILQARCCKICGQNLKGEVVSALNSSFHRHCFSCSECSKPFNPGDKVSLYKANYLCRDCIKEPVKLSERKKSSTINGLNSEKKHKSDISINKVKPEKEMTKTLTKLNGSTKEGDSRKRPPEVKSNGNLKINNSIRSHSSYDKNRLSVPDEVKSKSNLTVIPTGNNYPIEYAKKYASSFYGIDTRDSSVISNGSRGVSLRSSSKYKPKQFHLPEDRPRYRSMTMGFREANKTNGSHTPDTEYSLNTSMSQHVASRQFHSPSLSQSTDRYLFNGNRANTIHYYSKPSFDQSQSVRLKSNGHLLQTSNTNGRNNHSIIVSPLSGSIIIGTTDPITDQTIRLSSYPAGKEVNENEPLPVEKPDWPAPPEPSVILNEIMKKKRETLKNETNHNENHANGLSHSKRSSFSKDESVEDLSLDTSIDETLGKNLMAAAAPNVQPRPQKNFHFKTHCNWTEKVVEEFGRSNGDRFDPNHLISSSRSPDARFEPHVQIRYRNHNYASPSRVSYPRQSDGEKLLNYSMDFVNLGNRHWSADLSSQGSHKSFLNENGSEYLAYESNNSSMNSVLSRAGVGQANGLSRTPNHHINGRQMNGYRTHSYHQGSSLRPQSRNSMCNSSNNSTRLANSLSGFPPLYEDEQLNTEDYNGSEQYNGSEHNFIEETSNNGSKKEIAPGTSISSVFYCSTPSAIYKKQSPVNVKTLPYEQLNLLNANLPKGIDKTHLENYLSAEEFERIFNLSRRQFAHLPEWKQNDLKKRVNLF